MTATKRQLDEIDRIYCEQFPRKRTEILSGLRDYHYPIAQKVLNAMDEAMIDHTYFESGIDFWELSDDTPAYCQAVLRALEAPKKSVQRDCVEWAIQELAEKMAVTAAEHAVLEQNQH